jgi:hypothetical protein
MQLTDRVCQKHRPLVFLAGLLLVKEYARPICHLQKVNLAITINAQYRIE